MTLATVKMVTLGDRTNEEVADETEDEEPGHEIHRRRIQTHAGRSMGLKIDAQIIDQDRSEDSRGGPGGEQSPVDGADLHRAE